MTTVISDNREIVKLHQQFHKQLDEHLTKKIRCLVGYQGGSNEDMVKYYEGLDLWLIAQELSNKYWNGFGVGKPVEKGSNSLVCEINFSYGGGDRRIAGVFAKDDHGRIFILHRGNIGGGRKGVGRNSFVEHFDGDSIRAMDGDRPTDFCLVGELGNAPFHEQLGTFVHEVSRIKSLITSGKKS